MDFLALAQQCAPAVHPQTMAAVAHVESGFNPFAIGVVGGRLERQPATKAEAVATAKALAEAGYNFSVGVGQVNRYNLPKYGLDFDSAFEACANLRAGASILADCYSRARGQFGDEQAALQAAFSCYYSGNFSTGFKPDFKGQPSYVQKVLNSAGASQSVPVVAAPIPVIPTTRAKASPKPRGDEPFRVMTEGGEGVGPSASVYATPTDSVLVFR